MEPKSAVTIEETPLVLEGNTPTRVLSKDSQPQLHRRLGSVPSVLFVLLNVFIGATPIYFIVFGLLVFAQDGRHADLAINQNLLAASIYGPTIYPVIFAAVVGKFIKSLADCMLERGTTVAMIEYLMASRTVSGVLIAPLRFRVFRFIIFPLILLWSLSPLGSQASLRLVSTTTHYSNTSQIITYLYTNGSDSYTGGASGQAFYQNAVNSAFNAALFSPVAMKDTGHDLYGRVKIPMLEAVQELRPNSKTNDGWLSIQPQDYNVSMYSSIIGLPCSGMPTTGNTTFPVETSYFALDCSLSSTSVNLTGFTSKWQRIDPWTSDTAWNGGQMSITYDINHFNETSRPRIITLWSLSRGDSTLSVATCAMTTKYVEVQVSCSSGRCIATAIRKSTLDHPRETWSLMDGGATAARSAFNYFVNTTAKPHAATSSPLEFYLSNPRIPIDSSSEVILAKQDKIAFSRRFAQLLNSYWMISVSPDGALGKDFTEGLTRLTIARNVLGAVQTSESVLHCNLPWFTVLLLSSCIMLIAGWISTYLDARRRGPDVLDLFINALRESPHARLEHYSSLEEGSDQVRRLQHVRVRLGDIQPDADYGYAAIATPSKTTSVQRLKHDRLYR